MKGLICNKLKMKGLICGLALICLAVASVAGYAAPGDRQGDPQGSEKKYTPAHHQDREAQIQEHKLQKPEAAPQRQEPGISGKIPGAQPQKSRALPEEARQPDQKSETQHQNTGHPDQDPHALSPAQQHTDQAQEHRQPRDAGKPAGGEQKNPPAAGMKADPSRSENTEDHQARAASPVPLPVALPSGADADTGADTNSAGADTNYAMGPGDAMSPEETACLAANDIEACLRTGKLNAREFESSKDLSTFLKAIKLLDHACSLGSPEGCGKAGETYQLDALSYPDFKNGFYRVRKACKMNDPLGCHLYGYHYYAGRGVKKDFKKALPPLIKACKMGKGESCAVAGWTYRNLYRSGNNLKYLEKAIGYLKKACDLCKTGNCIFGIFSNPCSSQKSLTTEFHQKTGR